MQALTGLTCHEPATRPVPTNTPPPAPHSAAAGLEGSSDGSQDEEDTSDEDEGGGGGDHEGLLRRVAGQQDRPQARRVAVVNEAVAEDEHNVAAPAEGGAGLQLEDLLNATELDASARKQLQKLVSKPQVPPGHTVFCPQTAALVPHSASAGAGDWRTAAKGDTAAAGAQGCVCGEQQGGVQVDAAGPGEPAGADAAADGGRCRHDHHHRRRPRLEAHPRVRLRAGDRRHAQGRGPQQRCLSGAGARPTAQLPVSAAGTSSPPP